MLKPDPFEQFSEWYDEAVATGRLRPDAMALATADGSGVPSVRIVLYKGHSAADGFRFFTNFGSRKARELDANPRAALAMYWPETNKQVRIEGRVERLGDAENDEYFATRPRESQLAAWASEQSSVIPDRGVLLAAFRNAETKYPDAVPRPDFWGGYRLVPQQFEFWINQDHRLHDRFRYVSDDGWMIERLSP